MASRVSILGKAVLGLGLGIFLCPWPWPRALCPRLHLCLPSDFHIFLTQHQRAQVIQAYLAFSYFTKIASLPEVFLFFLN